jgi:hypothetical protein
MSVPDDGTCLLTMSVPDEGTWLLTMSVPDDGTCLLTISVPDEGTWLLTMSVPDDGTCLLTMSVPDDGTCLLTERTWWRHMSVDCERTWWRHMSYLFYLCLFAHSGVQHMLCCVFVLFVLRLVYPMLPRYAHSQQTCAVIRYAHSQQFGKPNNLKVQPICYIYFCSLYMLVCKTLHEYFLVIHIIDWFQSNRDIQHSFKLFEWKIVLHNKTFINSISPINY